MTGPLDGVKVVDLTAAASGPFATAILADQGADVIKVENPDGGDFLRTAGAVRNGVSGLFLGFNRGKRDLAVDLKTDAGVEIVRRLVAGADIFVENFRPGVTERLGLGYDALRTVNPDLIYMSITGFGESGPRKDSGAYDSVMQATVGIAAHQGDPETGRPEFVRTAICDKTTALAAAQLVTAALFARSQGRGGQRVHLSMLHSSLAFHWPDGLQEDTFVGVEGEAEIKRATTPPLRKTSDGWISFSNWRTAEFEAVCNILGLDELIDDLRFCEIGVRSRNADVLDSYLDAAVARFTTEEIAALLDAHRVPHALVNRHETLHEDPQIVANDLLVIQHHPDAGDVRAPRPIGDFAGTPTEIPPTAPRLGQHTEEILTNLGYDEAARSELFRTSVVA